MFFELFRIMFLNDLLMIIFIGLLFFFGMFLDLKYGVSLFVINFFVKFLSDFWLKFLLYLNFNLFFLGMNFMSFVLGLLREKKLRIGVVIFLLVRLIRMKMIWFLKDFVVFL